MVLAVLLISGCLTLATPEPLPTRTPLPSPTLTVTPTATTVWFPPTATPTAFPTPQLTPTQDWQPDLGAVLLADDFTESENWLLGQTGTGSAAFGVHELTIAISAPKIYVFSVRNGPEFSDFYAEITASPSLCRGLDEYGMLLRYTSTENYYRLGLSCDGQVRLERVYRGAASSPQPWTISGAVPPGAPSSSRLAVWAVGKEMRFFVNDQYQFTVNEPTLPSGRLGVFARSVGDKAVTVNFSNLVVREIK